MSKRRIGWGIGVGAVVLAVFAMALLPHPASAGLLDSIRTGFASSVAPMKANAAVWSRWIFGSIVAFEIIVTAYETVWTHDLGFVEGWATTLAVLSIGVFIIANQVAIADALSDQIAIIAGSFSGVSGPPLTPDGIAKLGNDVAGKIFEASPSNFAVNAVVTLPQFICSTLIGFAFVVVAVEKLSIDLAVQLCVALGSILLGFMATRWTRGYAAIWPRMMVTTLLVLVTVNAVVSVGLGVSAYEIDLVGKMNGAGISSILSNLSVMTAASLVYLLFGFGIPAFIGYLGASSPMTSGGAVRSAVAAVMGFVAARMGGASGAAAVAERSAGAGSIAAAARTS